MSPKIRVAFSARMHGLVTAASVLAVMSLTMFGVMHGPALASTDSVDLKFDVHFGSIRVLKISLGLDVDGPEYRVRTSIKSKGIVSLVANTKINMEAEGRIEDARLRPTSFSSRARSKGRDRRISLGWDGKFLPSATRNYDLSEEKRTSLAGAIRPGMIDPLSHIVQHVTNPGGGKPCSRTEYIYSGKVVSEYRYSLLGETEFGADTSGAYHGETLKCELHYRVIAGLSAKKQARQARKKSVFTIWFAPVQGQSGRLHVPVAVDGRISGRAFTMRLRSGSVSGQSLATRRAVAVKKNPDLSADR